MTHIGASGTLLIAAGIAGLGAALSQWLAPPSVNKTGTPAYFAEGAVHRLLYVLMLAVPLLGWLKTNAAGHAAS
ncbi:hypothetical protein [Paraburkholderia sp. HD33-4]|uniref:hypothetical protein n=1 Tax=Paraburkholderia sp. HD33-4 TaxID=2883242 RepID=UPI001F24B1CF|nr:hypothetical protein [Paraburkholderia sp. HD33-4]